MPIPTVNWAATNATPITNIRAIRETASQRYGNNYSKVEVAPWVRDCYCRENIAREKKKLRPLTWTRFIELMTDEKARKKMLVGDKFMKAALKSISSSRSA